MVQRLFLVLAREPKRTRLLPTVLDPRPGILPLSNRNQPPLYCARTVERPPASYFRTVHRYRFILRTWSNFTTPRGLVRSQSCLVGLYWTKQRKESARPANKDHRILNEWKQATLLIKVRLLSKASCRSANARPYSSLAPQYEPHTEQRPFNMMRRRGIRGILLNRRNIPIMSMPIESMLLAVNSNFLVFSVSSDDMMGQSFASLVSTVAAAESAIGLAIFVITFRVRGTIAVEFINSIQGSGPFSLGERIRLILKSFPKPLPVQLLKDRENLSK
ncbi:hypothetical protein HN51_043417 [Arachis hypogaea]